MQIRAVNFFTFLVIALFCGAGFSISAQEPTQTPEATPSPSPAATPDIVDAEKADPSKITPEQVAETAIFFYAPPGGRSTLERIRKTSAERGRLVVTDAEGKTINATYQRWTIRGETMDKERVRLEQDFPDARYSLIHANNKIFGIFNNNVFAPRDDAAKAFENQFYHGLDALLRYKESGSKLALLGREKVMGVEFHILEVTDNKDRKTKFFISVKSFKVMMLEYDSDGAKYKRKFYDYRYAQGTLVPFRTTLYKDGKITEEMTVGTITFGQKVDEGLFLEE